MSFTSYAGNLEDVILFRALKSIRSGFYIDVGAHHPLHGSVTRAFYDRGWRGINIEPLPSCFDLLRRERKRDVNINAALWSSQGERDFYEVVDDPSLSTVNESIGKGLVEAGQRVDVSKIPCTTLDAICAEHRVKEVHFLKIDTEGAEKSVLEGFAFDNVRPWVVVIEANEQWSTRDVSSEWEPLILDRNYLLAYYDGLNRFYVAAEHSDLLSHFGPPPNILDDYITYHHWSAQQELADERIQREALATRLQSTQHELAREQAQRESLAVQLQGVYTSYSWRVTAPMRKGYSILLPILTPPVRAVRGTLALILRTSLRSRLLRRTGARLLSGQPAMAEQLLRLARVSAPSSPPVTGGAAAQEPLPSREASWAQPLSLRPEDSTVRSIRQRIKDNLRQHEVASGSGTGEVSAHDAKSSYRASSISQRFIAIGVRHKRIIRRIPLLNTVATRVYCFLVRRPASRDSSLSVRTK